MRHKAVIKVHFCFAFELRQFQIRIVIGVHRFSILPETMLRTEKGSEWRGIIASDLMTRVQVIDQARGNHGACQQGNNSHRRIVFAVKY